MQLTPVNAEERKKLDIRPGDTIRVWQRITEIVISGKGRNEKATKKSRLQAFEGLVIARKHGTEIGATFTIRKISGGIGVELTLPLFSPKVEKIQLVSRPKRARRAKLYYLRERAARQVRKKMKQMKQMGEVMMDTPIAKPASPAGGPEEEKEEKN